ncbi:MAG: hypothetical protein ACRERU_12245 [Methylococcales bacterium]
MNRKPDRFPIPDHLPPESALALFECLSELVDAVWQHYETALLEQIIRGLNAPPDDDVEALPDDNIPF